MKVSELHELLQDNDIPTFLEYDSISDGSWICWFHGISIVEGIGAYAVEHGSGVTKRQALYSYIQKIQGRKIRFTGDKFFVLPRFLEI